MDTKEKPSLFLCVLCVLCAICAAVACRRQATASATRENAYRSNNLGVALLEQFKHEDAAVAFRQALGTDPSLAIAHVNLSLALLYTQDLQGAAREATEAARLMPSAPQPPYILGLIARAENRNDDAMRLFERVRQLDARDVGTAANLGQIYLQDRKYAEAIAILRGAVADEPYNVTTTYNLGLALTRAGQREEGQRLLEQSQALRSTGYGVTFGTTYLEQGRYAEAIASTGAEPELVDTAVPAATFTAAAIGAAPERTTQPSPFGRQFSAADLTPDGARALARALGGALTLIDFDGDGDLDVFIASPEGQRLIRNDGRGVWTDVTTASGLGNAPSNAAPIGCVTGDYDNDGMPDLFVLRYGASSLYHNEGNGRFRDVTASAGLPPYPFLPGAAAWVDVDHDGDLDLVIAGLADVAATRERAAGRTVTFPRDFAPAPVRLARNNGNGTFTDITRDAHLDVRTHAIAVVPTDFDNRRDIDLLIVNRDAPPLLFKNLRDGTFHDVAADVGLARVFAPNDEIAAVAAADINKDDFPDFFFARASGGIFALSDSRGRFTLAEAPAGTRAAFAAHLVDYDNDGLLDLLTWSADGPRVFRNLGTRWDDVTGRAVGGGGGDARQLASARALALADVDGDGNTDLITERAGTATVWRNSGDNRRQALRVQIKGVVSNRLGVGSKIQLRAGSLSERAETSAATPAIAPADIVFGLGGHRGADVVRVLWPSGTLQAETAGPPPATLPSPVSIEELNRKPSSCPFLFTWNGERFEFVTDFMGGGEMGDWEAPGRYDAPDPVEYVRIRGDQLRARDGRFDIRVTNELEETLFADRFQLLVIAHPRGIEVFPNEGMTVPPKAFQLHAVRDARVPVRAIDEHGHDVTDRIARLDRQYPDDFPLAPIRGYAGEHTLTLDVGGRESPDAPLVLLLTAWTDYAFSSDNVAAHQAGLAMKPPSLDIKDASGRWRRSVDDIGIPVGRPQTIAINLDGRLRPGEHEIRIVTTMRIYWDQILVATKATTDHVRIARIDPRTAVLRPRGFSAEVRPDGREPARYDYGRVTLLSPWKAMSGRYTREGDVRELLVRSDDMFVIAKPGDEIALDFDASPAGPIPEGWTRTFLLMADGFSKEMDINSGSPDAVEPLPFHRMTRYPYSASEHYPDSPAYRRYREMYNTRVVVRSMPSLDIPLEATKR